ncbi:conserved hypothetical protein [Coccidioides posadasii str. Silveira]|uniref:Uncharacterized protein n=1 Tax=Coccidioides posadasii (strain RMSCC 757 / Silveira) TaxID=443226 RepID=E9D9R4_COCPS|nr:conserved hypothetical protein [Coccidioides posadasii str. Silveira]
MVLLIITPAILSALESIPQSIRDDLSLPAPALNEAISHSQLITLSRKLSSTDSKGLDSTTRHEPSRAYSLNCLLPGAKLRSPGQRISCLPTSPIGVPVKSPPSPIFSHSSPTDEHPANTDDDALTPSLVLNILVSILFTGFATYWALTNFRTPQFLSTIFSFSSSNSAYAHNYPGSVYSQPSRVFISLLAAVVVGIAEVGVYAAYLRKVDMAKKKEKRIVEKKTVIGEVGVGSRKKDVDAGPLQDEDREKEEIWGKGVNGGVRRRVRERWKEKQDLEEK